MAIKVAEVTGLEQTVKLETFTFGEAVTVTTAVWVPIQLAAPVPDTTYVVVIVGETIVDVPVWPELQVNVVAALVPELVADKLTVAPEQTPDDV